MFEMTTYQYILSPDLIVKYLLNKSNNYYFFVCFTLIKDDNHDEVCEICRESGELLLCDTCNLVYHMSCLDPPLTAVPPGMWLCPKCKVRIL